MTSTPLHYATIWEAIADRIPERPALRHGGRVESWGEFEERSARLAGALRAHGIGVQDSVGLYVYNCPQFFEACFAALKIRAKSFNANYRYRGDELWTLLDNSEARALFYDAALRDRVASVVGRVPGLDLLVEIGEDGTGSTIPGSHRYEDLLAAARPAPRIERPENDFYLNYTGGTTGLPKGVLCEVGGSVRTALWFRDQYVDGARDLDIVDFAVRHAQGEAPICTIPASPVIHGVGFVFSSLPTLISGGTVTTLESRTFDADELLRTVGATRTQVVAMVGDAFALPIVRALDAGPPDGATYDTRSLRILCSAGVAWSSPLKARLLEHLPQVTLLDACGSTEGVTYGVKRARAGEPLTTASFDPAPGLRVVSPEGNDLPPGEVGLLAGPPHGRGYFRSREKSASTYLTLQDGTLCAVPGDLGRIEPDGTITLIGRGVTTINTGGEKVYPGEVEEVIRGLEHVDDCLVFGIPHERFGQAVAALVVPRLGHTLDADDLIRFVRASVAGYKVPSRLQFVDQVPRAINGKIDYEAALALMQREDQPT
jgi:3-oxocholest-4-en-26-oate---CoA ligase